jgi:hypothetical protein
VILYECLQICIIVLTVDGSALATLSQLLMYSVVAVNKCSLIMLSVVPGYCVDLWHCFNSVSSLRICCILFPHKWYY